MIFGREPALVLTFAGAIVNLALAFGLHLTDIQLASVNAVMFAAAGVAIRQTVTPNAKLNGGGK